MVDKKKDSVPEHVEILRDLEKFDKKYSESMKPPSDEPIAIRVSDDEMKVYVTVQPPLDASVEINKGTVIEELKKIGVSHGIDEAAIDDIFTFGTYNVEVVVAKGTPASDGISARIEYKFRTSDDEKVEMKADEFGNVDHRERSLIQSVEEGALLAIKIPSVPGQEGMTCLGKKLPAKEGRDVPLPIGENVKPTDDGLGVLATLSGQPVLRDGKISISAVYEVKGDVNYKTGNVNFKGTVIITGNVLSDFVVNASEDVEIYGNIEKAFIQAGGDVRVRGGMYGSNEGKILAGGSITIRSVESGILEAARNITLSQSARSSTLMAGEDIIVTNPKGSITGGRAVCGHHFDLANLGSPSFTETVIEIGMNPKIKEVYDELNKKLEDHKVQLEKVTNNIKTLKAKSDHLNEKEQELLKKLVPAFHKLRADIEADTAKVGFLREKMDKLSAGKCRVRGKTYPGVKIYSRNSTMAVRSEVNHSSFYEQNEQIIVGPY